MKKIKTTIFMILILSFSALPISLLTLVSAEPTIVLPDYEPVDWQSGLAGTLKTPDLSSGFMSDYTGISAMGPGDVGAVRVDWDVGGEITLRAVSDFVEIWVANDLSFPEGDIRNDDPYNTMISDEMVTYLAEEFDTFYTILTDYYGTPADRDGTDTIFEYYYVTYGVFGPEYFDWIETDTPQRVILKIFNIVDDNYFDPTYPSYVAGYFSSLYTNDYYNRNMINIDSWRWWQRLGDEGHQWFPDTAPELEVTRPNLYESTTAHEFQHNIHADQLPGDYTYMNEASSLFAEPLCGYDLDAGQIEWFLATPDNSLTQWGDQGGINILADYGAAFLWALYLTDHYGINFMGQYTQGGIVGIDGINALLEPFGKDFYDVFHDWRLANLLQMDSGPYGYELDEILAINPEAVLDFDELEPLTIHEIEARQLGWKSASKFFGETYTIGTTSTPQGYKTDTFNVGAFGTEYIMFTNLKGLEYFAINGDDEIVVPGWTYDEPGAYWYSGEGDLMNTLIAGEVYVDPADPFLTLTTYWDIEDYWDFGFVQVAPEGKWDSDWVSLENANTTYIHDTAAIIDAVNNLPGLTGWSEEIVEITFDMSAYAGQTVHLGFRFVTDWATFYEGWYLFSALVSGVEVLGDLAIIYPEVDFMVTVVENYGTNHVFVHDMWILNDATEIGLVFMHARRRENIVVVISPMMDLGAADYKFKIRKVRGFWFC